MNLKRLATILLICIVIAFFWVEIWLMISESKSLSLENSKLSNRLNALALDNKKIFEDIAYYANPKNLEKILREKFNYRSPSEKMIIVVPQQ